MRLRTLWISLILVSPAADYITGVILPVDGGYRLKDMRETSAGYVSPRISKPSR